MQKLYNYLLQTMNENSGKRYNVAKRFTHIKGDIISYHMIARVIRRNI